MDPGEECDDGNLIDNDGCSSDCRSELVPGGRKPAIDCAQEWLIDPAPPRGSDGIPVKKVECQDDNPLCDFGDAPGDGQCTFHVALCFNASETRFACTPSNVERVVLRRPREQVPRDDVDLANRDALENAIIGIGGAVQMRCYNPGAHRYDFCMANADCDSGPGTGDGQCGGRLMGFVPPLEPPQECTDFADIIVPLRSSTLKGVRVLGIFTSPARDENNRTNVDSNFLKLTCLP